MTIPEDEPLVVEFYDYGVEVDAKAPPADELISWEEMRKQWDPIASAEEPK